MYREGMSWSEEPRFARRNERVATELLVRYSWRGTRGTVLVKDLTPYGARIEGLEGLRYGDMLVLLLPDLPALDVTVAWAQARAAGLVFEDPIPVARFADLIRDHASPPPSNFPRAA